MPVPQDLTDRADLPDQRPAPADDLAGRLARLPPGHPSCPVDETGSRRPPVPSLRDLELADDASEKPAQDKAGPKPDAAADSGRPAEPGEWHGDAGHYLSAADNNRIEAACDHIATLEKHLTPRLQEIEAQDPTRHLAGLPNALKGRDRIKEKVAERIDQMPGTSVDDAVGEIGDAIRYTFAYDVTRYAHGVEADTGRLESRGFELVRLRNLWSHDQYKGINSRWRDVESGQLVEIQFHTTVSFEAKQVTHEAYERLRSGLATDQEAEDLQEFQRKTSAGVSVPAGAADIAEHG